MEEIERKLVEIPQANRSSVKDVLDKNSESVIIEIINHVIRSISSQVNSQAAFSLEKQLPLINRLFSIQTDSVETILENLKSDGSEFALKQLSILEKMVCSISYPFDSIIVLVESHIHEVNLRTIKTRQ